MDKEFAFRMGFHRSPREISHRFRMACWFTCDGKRI